MKESPTEILLGRAHKKAGEAVGKLSLALASKRLSRHQLEGCRLLLERAAQDLETLLNRDT